LTNRALVLAALASGCSVIEAPLLADDTVCMVRALRALGIQIEPIGPGRQAFEEEISARSENGRTRSEHGPTPASGQRRGESSKDGKRAPAPAGGAVDGAEDEWRETTAPMDVLEVTG